MKVADLLAALALAALALFCLWHSWELMLQTQALGNKWQQSAGLFPAVVAGVLLIFALGLGAGALRTIKAPALREAWNTVQAHKRATIRGIAAFFWFVLYILVGLPLLGYAPATGVFLFTAIAAGTGRIVLSALVSFAVSTAVTLVFFYVVQIPLP